MTLDTQVDNTIPGGGLQMNALDFFVDNGASFTFFADASPAPDPDALYRHVWAEENPNGRLFFDGRER